MLVDNRIDCIRHVLFNTPAVLCAPASNFDRTLAHLNDFKNTFWKKPNALKMTININVPGKEDQVSLECIDLEVVTKALEVLSLAPRLTTKLLIREEYVDAYEAFSKAVKEDEEGVAVLGQPGIGEITRLAQPRVWTNQIL